MADCLDLTLMAEGEMMDDAVAELREAMLGYLESIYDLGWEAELTPRRAPLYRWLRFYRCLLLHTLRALFTQRFDGFLAYEERPLGDRLVYA